MQRVVVATDRSQTAERAVAWAGELAGRYGAELVIVQVIPAENGEVDIAEAEASLLELARELAGERGRARVRIHPDPPRAIVDAAIDEGADVLVVGNPGMSGRKEFLLGNVPNRISHNARCTVVIVNTTEGSRPRARARGGEHAGGGAARPGARIGACRRHGTACERARPTRRPRNAPTLARGARAARPDVRQARPDPVDAARPAAARARRGARHLQDQVPPLTEAEVVAVMEQELQVPWEDVFESIDPVPMAAGTIGQVHRARWRTATASW